MDASIALQHISKTAAQGPYSPSWDALAAYTPPAWFRKAKFGIFIHWGLYSVPAFRNEWYSRNMYRQGTEEFEYHKKTFGDHKQFGFKDFIPMFTAPAFQPEAWADLFCKAGARYVVPVAEHHDGFQMYKSALSPWNAAEMGPKRDVLGEVTAACQARGLVTGLSSHRAEHWFFLGHGREFDSDIHEPLQKGDFYWPSVHPEPEHQDLYSTPAPNKEFLDDWLLRCCELVDHYKPRIFYFDWWIQHEAFKPYLQQFAAYYYNRASEWGFEPVISYKHDAFAFGTAVVDIERGKFAEAKPYPWQACTAVAKNSWCHVQDLDYKKASTLLCDLIDITSKNGCMLLNIGPRADGGIPEGDAALLEAMGKWLAVNGEAIYDTIPWRFAEEGPARQADGAFADGLEPEYSARDIRYTAKGSAIYAIALRGATDGHYAMHHLSTTKESGTLPLFHGIIRSVTQLGAEDLPLRWRQDGDALHVDAPPATGDLPVAFQIEVR